MLFKTLEGKRLFDRHRSYECTSYGSSNHTPKSL